MDLNFTPWTGETPATEEELRELLEEQQLKVYHWKSGPEEVFGPHTHSYHKVLYVLKGNINFEFSTRHERFKLKPGDRLDIPGGLRHNAVAGVDGVTCLEAHIY